MRKIDIIGQVFENKLGQKYIVLSEDYCNKTEYHYRVKFLVTGTEKIVEKRNLKAGRVKDQFALTIYDVACKGNSSSKYPLLNKIAFKRWYAMIERCYNKNAIGYNTYGNSGVTVCDRWLCFDNYLADLPLIFGYSEERYINGKLQLDKDFKIKNNKTYSPENCIFIYESINKKNQPNKKRDFIAISPEGIYYNFNNQNECARQFNLNTRGIGKVLNKQLNHHKDWKFYYKSDT